MRDARGGTVRCPPPLSAVGGGIPVAARLAGSRTARRGTRCARSLAAVVVIIAVLPAGSVSAAPSPRDGGEIFGRATRSSAPTSPAAVAAVPAGFSDNLVFGGLTFPTAIAFAPGGKVFVGEKRGIVKVFDSTSDPAPTQVVDLRPAVHDFWDRGLLGLAVDPGFGTAGRNFVYVLYTHDHNPLGNPAAWGDACPSPPGPTTDGCTVTGNLSRIPVDPTSGMASGPEQPLITDDWCQQYPSHSIGHLAFGPDGNLYVSGGDGASFTNTDWGQFGGGAGSPTPANPCGDPPSPVGTPLSPPGAEGGALRSQSPRRVAGHPILLDGAVLRVDPATGNGVAGNPMFDPQNPSSNASRIIGYGLRNPFRFTFRPGTSELWVGDVGWGTWEEVDRMTSPTPANPVNFGWPCYEGAGRMSNYDSANLTICENLYTDGTLPATGPYYTYHHSASVVPGDGCPLNQGSVISAISFYGGGSYPGTYDGALFFGDHSRNCIWAMLPGGNGLPSPSNLMAFVVDPNSHPVDLATDPATGDLFYANFEGGQIRRIQYANNPPQAVATANPTSGPAPLTVQFNGSGSSDPDGDPITYSWDLNGDGTYGDSTAVNPIHTYPTAGTFQVTLRVTDSHGSSSVSTPITITVGAGNTAPTPVIDAPTSGLTWAVGDRIGFSGHATDAQDGTLPASALSWQVIIHHGDHTHTMVNIRGVASGSFFAPDHDYPSYLELRLTATDSGGLTGTTSVNLQPRTANLTFQSSPSGLQLTAGLTTARAPFTITAIVNGQVAVNATSPQTYRHKNYVYVSWSDGGAQQHIITVPATNATYTATYRRVK
jgi:glucose/arabinose dehydrogenase